MYACVCHVRVLCVNLHVPARVCTHVCLSVCARVHAHMYIVCACGRVGAAICNVISCIDLCRCHSQDIELTCHPKASSPLLPPHTLSLPPSPSPGSTNLFSIPRVPSCANVVEMDPQYVSLTPAFPRSTTPSRPTGVGSPSCGPGARQDATRAGCL